MSWDNYTVMASGDIDPDDLSDTEKEILRFLARDGRGSPGYIADELGYTQEHIRSLLSQLLRLGLVNKPYRGLYEISDPEYVEKFNDTDS